MPNEAVTSALVWFSHSMTLTKHDIEAFKGFYEAEFSEEIDWEQAERMAQDVINLYELLWQHRSSECRCCPIHTASRCLNVANRLA